MHAIAVSQEGRSLKSPFKVAGGRLTIDLQTPSTLPAGEALVVKVTTSQLGLSATELAQDPLSGRLLKLCAHQPDGWRGAAAHTTAAADRLGWPAGRQTGGRRIVATRSQGGATHADGDPEKRQAGADPLCGPL